MPRRWPEPSAWWISLPGLWEELPVTSSSSTLVFEAVFGRNSWRCSLKQSSCSASDWWTTPNHGTLHWQCLFSSPCLSRWQRAQATELCLSWKAAAGRGVCTCWCWREFGSCHCWFCLLQTHQRPFAPFSGTCSVRVVLDLVDALLLLEGAWWHVPWTSGGVCNRESWEYGVNLAENVMPNFCLGTGVRQCMAVLVQRTITHAQDPAVWPAGFPSKKVFSLPTCVRTGGARCQKFAAVPSMKTVHWKIGQAFACEMTRNDENCG